MTADLSKEALDARIADHAAWAARGRWREAYDALHAESELLSAEIRILTASNRGLVRLNEATEARATAAEAALAAAMNGAVDRDRVAEAMEGGGFWRSCSGCHESNEGVPTGPYSAAMECFLGVGCYECGGIGAVWDNTDYSRLYDEVEANPAAQDREAPTAPSWPAAENTTLPAIDETTGALIRKEGEA